MTSKLLGTGPLRILLLSGGPSTERDISLKSGEAIAKALSSRGHLVTNHDPRNEQLTGIERDAFDVACIALHGRYGEDGTVQSQLDEIQLPYTGSGPAASALAFCKSAAKRRFHEHAVPTPVGCTFHVEDEIEKCVLAAQSIGFPLVVKPDRQGSSLGVSMVYCREDVRWAVEQALMFDSQGLVEMAIPGEEWTVPLLDEVIFPPIRIATPATFFDYEAKYQRHDTAYQFPDDVAPDQLQRIATTALRAAQALGVTGLSRVDLRIDAEGRPVVLEVNTVPGMTDHSLAPKSAERFGWSLPFLCEEMCRRALTLGPNTRCKPHDRQAHQSPPPFRRAS